MSFFKTLTNALHKKTNQPEISAEITTEEPDKSFMEIFFNDEGEKIYSASGNEISETPMQRAFREAQERANKK